MKKLSIKEKAKLYDKAFKEAKAIHKFSSNIAEIKRMEEIFPELKENEGERIRKELVAFLKETIEYGGISPDIWTMDNAKKWIAWLEKQGEQKPADICDSSTINGKEFPASEKRDFGYFSKPTDKVGPKFHDGDWVILSLAGEKDKLVQIQTIEYFPSGQPRYVTTEGKWYGTGVNARLWTIQDAKDGDVLCYKDEISLYKHEIKNCTKQGTTFGGFVYHCCYDGKGFVVDSLYSLTEQDKMDILPATKEQRDLLFQKMKEAGYMWDTEKKELKKIEQKPAIIDIDKMVNDYANNKERGNEEFGKPVNCMIRAYRQGLNDAIGKVVLNPTWSEEDETALGDALWCCKQAASIAKDENDMGNVWYAETWLKSLKDKIQPKQEWSEEDEVKINRIVACLENLNVADNDILLKDVAWLKSLRPQNTWKPSDEQMEALKQAKTDACGKPYFNALASLYVNLKLREE